MSVVSDSKLTFTAPTDWGILQVAQRLRDADVGEIWASVGSGHSPLEVIEASARASDHAYIAYWEDEPLCVFGVVEGGKIWMMGTDLMSEIPTREVVTASRDILDKMLAAYPKLWNVVWAKNELHIRWLEFMGAEMTETVRLGPYQDQFIMFEIS